MTGNVLLLGAQKVSAQEQDNSISIELNNAQSLNEACRLSFLVRNDLGAPLQELGLEIVILDSDGLAQDLMVLNTGSLTPGKRRLRQFDLPDLDCDKIGEILINDISECQSDAMTPAACLAALRLSHRTEIKLGL